MDSHGSGEVRRRWYPEHRWGKKNDQREEKEQFLQKKQEGRREEDKHGSEAVVFVRLLA